eukprot:TRINITY_DN19243_c0_g1_i2.p1 TRINITY_DN19243_c0_g1~~TRINITY_DN19243_c0_g1_i2.p1  ORF type:complete len:857 (+),score=250.29 TRINITY_DN19243_c0_g1_i2:82-2571(+)
MPEKEMLNFKLGGMHFRYKGFREKRQNDFFEMFIRLWPSVVQDREPDSGDLARCYRSNFHADAPDGLWDGYLKEKVRIEERRQKKERRLSTSARDSADDEDLAGSQRKKEKKKHRAESSGDDETPQKRSKEKGRHSSSEGESRELRRKHSSRKGTRSDEEDGLDRKKAKKHKKKKESDSAEEVSDDDRKRKERRKEKKKKREQEEGRESGSDAERKDKKKEKKKKRQEEEGGDSGAERKDKKKDKKKKKEEVQHDGDDDDAGREAVRTPRRRSSGHRSGSGHHFDPRPPLPVHRRQSAEEKAAVEQFAEDILRAHQQDTVQSSGGGHGTPQHTVLCSPPLPASSPGLNATMSSTATAPPGGQRESLRKFKLHWDGSETLKLITLRSRPGHAGAYDELVQIAEARCDGHSCLSYIDWDGDRIEVDDDESLESFFEELQHRNARGERLVMHCSLAHAPVTAECRIFAPAPSPAITPLAPPAARLLSADAPSAVPPPDGSLGASAAAGTDTPATPQEQSEPSLKPEQVLPGHQPSGTYGCTFDPSGSLVLSASRDKSLQIWDRRTAHSLHKLLSHNGMVLSCDWSPNGRYIVSSSDDKTVRTWDCEGRNAWKKRSVLKGHSDKVYMAVFSKDSRYIVSASMDKTVKIWDVISGKKLQTLKGHTGSVFACCFCPDAKTVVSAGDDHTIKLWRWQEKHERERLAWTLTGHSQCLWSVCFSPDGSRVLSTGMDKVLLLTNVADRSCAWRVADAHAAPIHRAVFCRDGALIASCSRDKSIRFWDATHGSPVGIIAEAHSGFIYCVAAWQADIVSASHEGTLMLWKAPEVPGEPPPS